MIHLILGPMKAGKSKRLLQEYIKTTDPYNPKESVLIIPEKGFRDFISRDDIEFEGHRFNIKIQGAFYGHKIALESYKNIFVDELQFLEAGFLEEIILQGQNKNIFISGLLSNYKQEVWGNTIRILPYATQIEVLNANCDICHSIGNATYNIKNNSDEYKTICNKCFIKFKQENLRLLGESRLG